MTPVRKRAIYALVSPFLLLVLWHHGAWRTANAYLLFGYAAHRYLAMAIHGIGWVLGAFLVSRKSRISLQHNVALFLIQAWVLAVTLIGAFFAFSNRQAFQIFVYSASILFGISTGALAASLFRTFPALTKPQAPLFDLLRIPTLLPTLVAAPCLLSLAHRAGPLRAGIGLCALTGVLAHLAASTLKGGSFYNRLSLQRIAAISSYLFGILLILIEPLTPWHEVPRLPDPIVLYHTSAISRLVLTSGRGAFQLYVDSALAFSTLDSHRQRETTVHPAMSAAAQRTNLLVIGGGDGIAVREVLRYPDATRITVLEPDVGLVHLARHQPVLLEENKGALLSPRVHIEPADPLTWLRDTHELYDVILLLVPDVEGPERGKLFTAYFYSLLHQHMHDNSIGSVRVPIPLSQRRAYWCVVKTLEHASFFTLPYHAAIPTYGIAGYVLFSKYPILRPRQVLPGLSYLDSPTLASMFAFSPDESPLDAQVNRLYHQVLLTYREEPDTQ